MLLCAAPLFVYSYYLTTKRFYLNCDERRLRQLIAEELSRIMAAKKVSLPEFYKNVLINASLKFLLDEQRKVKRSRK